MSEVLEILLKRTLLERKLRRRLLVSRGRGTGLVVVLWLLLLMLLLMLLLLRSLLQGKLCRWLRSRVSVRNWRALV